jgi:hypothetical protein
MFLVAYPTSGGLGVNEAFVYFASSAWGHTGVGIYQGGISWRFGTGQSGNLPNASSSIGANYAIAMANKNGATETGWVNGTRVYSNASFLTTLANNSSVVMLGEGGGGLFSQNIAEIVTVFDILDTTRQTQMEGYLAWKWGLQSNLPISHLYRYAAPTNKPPPTSAALAIVSGTATMTWTAAAGATSNSWILYRSSSSNYAGTSNASGATAGATATATATGLTTGYFWYFAVSTSNAPSSVSAAAVSSIVSY